jgi:RNA polymerase-binding transcription factor DksA
MDPNTIRQRLHAQVADILRRHQKIEGSRRRERTPLEGDWKEDAIVRGNDDVLEALDADGRAHLARLRAALERLEDGTYGRCVDCDAPIALARLEALPEITTCIDCAAAAEAGGPDSGRPASPRGQRVR